MINLLLKLFVKDYKNTSDSKVKERYGLLASFFGLISNFLLFAFKMVAGIMLHLYSIITDSVNNLSDFGTNFLSIVGVKAANKPADEDHPFGHQRIDYIMSLIIGCIVIALGTIMMYQGIKDLVEFVQAIINTGKLPTREFSYVLYVVSLTIMSASIAVKVLQATLYYQLGKRINSLQLKSLSKDSLNDVISTSFVIVGILVSWFSGYDIDCFFTIVVAAFVILSGVGIMKEAITILIGQKPDKSIVDSLIKLIYEHKDVIGVHDLMMHYYGDTIYGVIHIEVDAKKDVFASHEMCDDIENEALEKLHLNLTVHMDPVLVDDPDTDLYKNIIKGIIKGYQGMKMHDFRILDCGNKVTLAFDLVLSGKEDTPEFKEKLLSEIKDRCKINTEKELELKVNFDHAELDYLKGTKAEEIDG